MTYWLITIWLFNGELFINHQKMGSMQECGSVLQQSAQHLRPNLQMLCLSILPDRRAS
jgi:hypothetical protein